MMASVLNIGINNEKSNENAFTSSKTEMSKSFPAPSNTMPPTRESYWFAHGGIEETKPGNDLSNPKSDGDTKEQQLQKDKEERIRLFREHQEEERLKKLKELEQQFMMSKKHRELQEEERRRRIEEARVKELERRHQVEERKRQIWEAEQERKEAILRRNMEREARIEARRNAQRNSQCFAFGSSTPRTFDLDLAAIGRSVNQGSVLMSSVSGRRSEEREICPPRATSACSLDRKFGEDCMSRSMISLSSSSSTTFRGRKKTDIMPTLTRERSITPHITPRGNQSMRAVSMTRLDQLAQPRRTYQSPRNPPAITTTTANGGPRTVSLSMSMSMCNLAHASAMGKRRHVNILPTNCKSNMSQSMLHLADKPSHKDSRHFIPSPTQPRSGMRSAQSMMHLAAPPRLTRAARLRAQALAGNRAASAWNLNKTESGCHYLSSGKDTSRSPSRPQSSMSGNSEISATSSSISGVNMRVRPAPRRPRPVSVAGTITDNSIHSLVRREFERQPRLQDKHGSAQKPERAKSASRDKSDIKQVKPSTVPKKPIPPPKSSEVLARAKSHTVPIKDNLRRVAKNSTVKSSLKSENREEPKKTVNGSEKLNENMKSELDVKSNASDSEVKLTSPLTSPSVELESLLSSEDSKASVAVEIDSDSVSQSVADSENKISNLDPVSTEMPVVPALLKEKDDVIQNIQIETAQPEEKISTAPPEKSTETVNKDFNSAKPRITSEEEARAALAEKRRLAREQAEREAELERQRLEEIRRIEEEQRKLEEAEQKRMEEEQIRLAKLHRELEEEKLRRAIEEREQRDKEEQEKKDEEARLKAEREEQERKAREEAEKQRIELEEKLRKEEEERAERKRRVEQIMARTRGKSAQSPSGSVNESNFKVAKNSESTNNDAIVVENKSASNNETEYALNGSEQDFVSEKTSTNNAVNDDSLSTFGERQIPMPLPDLLNSETIANHTSITNGQYTNNEELLSQIKVSNSFSLLSNKTTSANATLSPQSNGYSSHEEMSCTTSPEENADTSLLIDVQSCELKTSKLSSTSTDFTKLVDLEPPSLDNTINNENFLINVDDINSNLLNSGNSFIDFDDSRQKDKPAVDLLS